MITAMHAYACTRPRARTATVHPSIHISRFIPASTYPFIHPFIHTFIHWTDEACLPQRRMQQTLIDAIPVGCLMASRSLCSSDPLAFWPAIRVAKALSRPDFACEVPLVRSFIYASSIKSACCPVILSLSQPFHLAMLAIAH